MRVDADLKIATVDAEAIRVARSADTRNAPLLAREGAPASETFRVVTVEVHEPGRAVFHAERVRNYGDLPT